MKARIKFIKHKRNLFHIWKQNTNYAKHKIYQAKNSEYKKTEETRVNIKIIEPRLEPVRSSTRFYA